jgi:hypothetical protein
MSEEPKGDDRLRNLEVAGSDPVAGSAENHSQEGFMFEYSYFIGTLVMLIVWSILYATERSLKRPMIVFSLLAGVSGFFSAFVYNQDWWMPLTITHTFVGIEDFLFSFTIGGIAAVIGTRFGRSFQAGRSFREAFKRLIIMILMIYVVGLVAFLFGIHSFFAALIACTAAMVVLLHQRFDLLGYAPRSGLFTLIALLPAYWIPEILNPGWLTDTWMVENLTGFTLFGIVIEDIIWVFFAAAITALLFRWMYEKDPRTTIPKTI